MFGTCLRDRSDPSRELLTLKILSMDKFLPLFLVRAGLFKARLSDKFDFSFVTSW